MVTMASETKKIRQAAKALQSLQDEQAKALRRVGGLQSISADIRIIAATNRNLYQLVQAQKFRLDLFYRLNVVRIDVPPLRTLHAVSPLATLDRGYAIVTTADGTIIGNARDLASGADVAMRFAKGRAQATVTKVEPDEP